MTDTATLTRDQPPAGPGASAARRQVRATARAVATSLAVALLVVATAAALWWRSEGGRWFVVETPSMGTALPVGTLVLTTPVEASDVTVGDVVTFRAPESGTVYTHRVVELVAGDGSGVRLVTQGDVNAVPDPGSVGQADLVGEVVRHVDGLGWALAAVPMLVVGGAATWLLSLLLARRRRRGARLLGASVTLAVTNWLLHPWVGLEKIAQRSPDDGDAGLLVDVLSVGLLPVRAEQVGGGASARLTNGELVTLPLQERGSGAYAVVAALDLAWWGWLVVVATCLVPLLVSVTLRPSPEAVAA